LLNENTFFGVTQEGLESSKSATADKKITSQNSISCASLQYITEAVLNNPSKILSSKVEVGLSDFVDK